MEQFVVEDTIFQGVEGRGTALVLNEVTAASIERCSFLSNTHSSTFEHHDTSTFTTVQATLDYVYLNRNSSLAVGGALYTVFSNALIVNSKFMNNTAEIGGAVFADNSSLHVVGNTYSYNRGSFGGVMTTAESSVNIESSTFSENRAEVFGGVMVTYRDSSSSVSVVQLLLTIVLLYIVESWRHIILHSASLIALSVIIQQRNVAE